ncbi:MAG: DNA polymerase III subunit alpha, partial [Clostridia bacterium]|nr:DNA polymerase III subunit alpha [Clostridia bacterium]
RELAGYLLGRADLVRRAMSKKKHDVMEKEREIFIHGLTEPDGTVTVEGCIRRGVSKEIADRIFDDMSSFASYAFNKSHAAAYALVAYRTAWLKCRYPGEYMAALLTSAMDSGKVASYIAEAERMGLNVLPPSVNESEDSFVFRDDHIRFGLLAIKNLGRGLLLELQREREKNGPYTGFYDFCRRLSAYRECNRRAIESLVKAGALDELGANRAQMLSALPGMLAQLGDESRNNVSGQIGFFDDPDIGGGDSYPLPDLPEYSFAERLTMEKEVAGMYLTGHPMAPYREAYRRLRATRTGTLLRLKEEPSDRYTDGSAVCLLGMVSGLKQKTTKSGATMAYCQLEDLSGSVELVIFPRQLAQYGSMLREGATLIVQGKLTLHEEEEPRVTAENLRPAPPPEQITAPEPSPRHSVPPRREPGLATPPPTVSAPPPPSVPAAPSAHRGLYLRIPSLDSREWRRALLVLDIFTGTEPLFLRCADTGKMVKAPSRYGVWPDEELLRELARIFGVENVRWIP